MNLDLFKECARDIIKQAFSFDVDINNISIKGIELACHNLDMVLKRMSFEIKDKEDLYFVMDSSEDGYEFTISNSETESVLHIWVETTLYKAKHK